MLLQHVSPQLSLQLNPVIDKEMFLLIHFLSQKSQKSQSCGNFSMVSWTSGDIKRSEQTSRFKLQCAQAWKKETAFPLGIL